MIPEEKVLPLFNPHIRTASSESARQKTARHWFFQASKREAHRLAAIEIKNRFWQKNRESENVWLVKAMTRARMGICSHLEGLMVFQIQLPVL